MEKRRREENGHPEPKKPSHVVARGQGWQNQSAPPWELTGSPKTEER